MDRVKVELLTPQQARAVMTETVLPAIKAHLIAGRQHAMRLLGIQEFDFDSIHCVSCLVSVG